MVLERVSIGLKSLFYGRSGVRERRERMCESGGSVMLRDEEGQRRRERTRGRVRERERLKGELMN